MLVNPGFETPGTGNNRFATWVNPSLDKPQITADTSVKHSGTTSCKITRTSDTNWYSPQVYQTITVTPNTQYRLSFWVYGDGTYQGSYALYDNTHAAYISSAPTQGGFSSASQNKVTAIFTTPTGCTSLRLFLTVGGATGSTPSGAFAYFDDVAIQAITSSVSGTPQRVILPNRFTAVVGEEIQLYTRGIVEAQDPYRSPVEFVCSKGKAYPRYFSYTPVFGDVTGSPYTLTVNVLDETGTVISSDNVLIDVIAAGDQPASQTNVFCLGDSLTAGGIWPKELYRRLTQAGGNPVGKSYGNISLIGDRYISTYPTQAFTGFGGWKWSNYAGTDTGNAALWGHTLTVASHDKTIADVGSFWTCNGKTYIMVRAVGKLKFALYNSTATEVDTLPLTGGTMVHSSGAVHTASIVFSSATKEQMSPFWNPSKSGGAGIDFTQWATDYSYSSIDVLHVLLGWNGMSSSNLALATNWLTTDIAALLTQFHTDFPSAKVKLMGIQIPSPVGGLGKDYGATGVYSNYYKLLRNVNGLNLAYQAFADANSTWVEFISVSQQFDSEYNMQMTETNVNNRNSSFSEMLGSNGVHPANEGYYQIADSAYRNFIKNYTV